jgi:beta-lactamase class A
MLEEKLKEYIDTQKGNVAVIIKNLKNNSEIKINSDMEFPSASIIKIAIMSELFNKINQGIYEIDDIIEIKEEMKTGGDGILKELYSGHKFTLKEICTLMIIVSDNTATNILIDLLGLDNINIAANKLGLKKTKLQRKMMDSLAVKEGRNNFTSADDFALILELIYKCENVNEIYSNMMLNILKKQQVRGRLDLYLPEEVVIAHKTGDLDNLEHDGGIVFLPDREYIICVLTNEVVSNKDGREIIGTISKMVYDKMTEGKELIF